MNGAPVFLNIDGVIIAGAGDKFNGLKYDEIAGKSEEVIAKMKAEVDRSAANAPVAPLTADDLSPEGANPGLPGFSSNNLKLHWNKHSKHYPGWTEQQYEQRAEELVRSEVGGDILGFKAKNGSIVRYDMKTNDYAIGYVTGIGSMFKLDRGLLQYYERKKRDK